MGRQKKRTMKKYNRSQRKNNTRRKTHKKRVRKTHKKRTHKRMKGGSREGLISGENKSQSTSERVSAPLQTLKGKAGSLVQSAKDKVSRTGSPTNLGYEKQTDASSPVQVAPPQEVPAQGAPAQGAPAQGGRFSSIDPKYISGAKEVAKLGTAVAAGANLPVTLGVLGGVAVGAAGAKAALEAGKAGNKLRKSIGRGIGSAVDNRKANKLMKNIKECLETLISYAVISKGSKDTILEKLRKNSGYFDEQGNAPKITFKKELRDAQIQAKRDADTANQAKLEEEQYALNVGETPETVVNTASQQLSGSPPSSTDVTSSVGAGTEAQPFTYPAGETDTTPPHQTSVAASPFDFLEGFNTN